MVRRRTMGNSLGGPLYLFVGGSARSAASSSSSDGRTRKSTSSRA
ncbi:MAG: hypothetical protein ABR961_09830 [Thermoanaerobaculaceae bacterium]